MRPIPTITEKQAPNATRVLFLSLLVVGSGCVAFFLLNGVRLIPSRNSGELFGMMFYALGNSVPALIPFWLVYVPISSKIPPYRFGNSSMFIHGLVCAAILAIFFILLCSLFPGCSDRERTSFSFFYGVTGLLGGIAHEWVSHGNPKADPDAVRGGQD